jgi:uncharacterized protein (DUF924 family)
MVTPDDVLHYWFGDTDRNNPSINSAKGKLWWGKAEATDAEIERRFGEALAAAGRGELDDWAATPSGRVALIIVLDQFSRNIHRGSAAMYEHDARAERLAQQALDAKLDADLAFFERMFLYMPLMHTEDLAQQERCCEAFAALTDGADTDALRKVAEYSLDFARRHRDIVERFGRFPHRNELLGRDSTPEETEFLEQPGSSF